MKIVRFFILCFYLLFVIPMSVIMIVSLAYGGIVETIKLMRKP